MKKSPIRAIIARRSTYQAAPDLTLYLNTSNRFQLFDARWGSHKYRRIVEAVEQTVKDP
jgi:hypothetical protein